MKKLLLISFWSSCIIFYSYHLLPILTDIDIAILLEGYSWGVATEPPYGFELYGATGQTRRLVTFTMGLLGLGVFLLSLIFLFYPRLVGGALPKWLLIINVLVTSGYLLIFGWWFWIFLLLR